MVEIERRARRRLVAVVVPAVRVVVGDDHGGVLPVRLLLQEVDHLRDERLFVERIRVARVAVADRRRLQEADRRIVAGLHRGEEVVGVVLVVHRRCRVVERGSVDADHRRRRRTLCASGWPSIA